MTPLSVLIPLPLTDFDPTEVAVSWQILHQAGIKVSFATPDGARAFADPLMISGQGLDPWGQIPILNKLKLVGLLLRADRFARAAYRELELNEQFLQPLRYEDIDPTRFHGLLLPGGHAKGMRPYLENSVLQLKVAKFFEQQTAGGQATPIAAVCHGVVLAARSVSPTTGKSALHGLKTTALPWDFERKAWKICQYYARFWDAGYYRTYLEQPGEPVGYASVEQEVKRALASPEDFLNVPASSNFAWLKRGGIFRDRMDDDRPAWVVQDGHYISARWPGDVHTFGLRFLDLLEKTYR